MKDFPITFSPHSLESMRKRGTTKEEVERVIREVNWQEARNERFEAKHNFSYHAKWNKKFYETKQVNPIFIIDREKIIVITVYVFYF